MYLLKSLILCANLYLEMDMSGSDEENDDVAILVENHVHTLQSIDRINACRAAVVPISKWTGDQYKMILKVSAETFEFLYKLIAPRLQRLYSGMPMVAAHLQLMVAVHKLTTPKTYRDASEVFQLKKSTGYRCTNRVVGALNSLAPAFMKWPSAVEAKRIAEGFLTVSGFPGIIGNIGRCKLKVLHLLDKHNVYEVPFQAICDSTKKFTYCHVATPVNTVTSREPALHLLLHVTIYPNMHLIAKKSYPLCDKLMVPYEEAANDMQKNYNKRISAALVIEDCLQSFITRFESLQNGLSLNERVNKSHVVACCVLHNICRLKGDEYVGERVQIEAVRCSLIPSPLAEAVRDAIAHELT